jgi:glycosyltransferase involved in cell wall biosynthesis
VDVSVVISTYNRAALLKDTVASVCESARAAGVEWELVVVDNNSGDDSARVVAAAAEAEPRVRSVFEGRQGVSFGRNAGVAASRGRVVLFTDDDVLVDPAWVATTCAPFADPGVAFVMGRVLARWDAPRPAWLSEKLTGPIGVCDPGDAPLDLGPHPPCLPMTANLAVQRDAFDRVGGFDTSLGPRGRHAGEGGLTHFSGEDHEFGLRLVEAGLRGRYVPSSVVFNRVNAERLTKGYVRRWMYASGRAYSIMWMGREAHLRHWFGVPRYMFRRALRHIGQWTWAVLRLRGDEMFLHQVRLLGVAGFLRQRWRDR